MSRRDAWPRASSVPDLGTGVDHSLVFHRTGEGIGVVDTVERHRYTLSTASGSTLSPADPDQLLFPVDAAVELTTADLRTPTTPALYVRDAEGAMLATTEPPMEQSFPAGEYYVEICAPMKLYLRVAGPLTVTATGDGKRIRFDDPRRVVVGARSKHDRPAATVTTTRDPEAVMAAISTFGSALKTTSPERSFPTLRGHPPTIELGESLSIPDGLGPPATGVTVEVPPEYRYVYPVASLAFYLGARVRPGERPRLVLDDGTVHDLGVDGTFERTVRRVLAKTFLLDCVTRTEGLYDVPLHERRVLDDVLDLDFARLYDQPLSERVATALEVPYQVLEPHVPEWKLTTYVEPGADVVAVLPFLVNDLAVIQTATPGERDGDHSAVDDQTRAAYEEALGSFFRRSGATEVSVRQGEPGDAVESMERAWVGEGLFKGATKATVDAYRNRLDRSPVAGDIGVTVVCNDPEMIEERDVVDATYESNDGFPLSVTVREGVTTAELASVLAGDDEFVHYIGHIDEDGFDCVDGTLDAATIETTGVDAFLLNACSSYEQGLALIEAGAVGGIVTLANVVNEGAVRIGATVARLLNNGYPLRPALEIAQTATALGNDYLVVGDGTMAIALGSTTLLMQYTLESRDQEYELGIHSYANTTGGMGTMQKPYLEGVDEYYVTPGELGTFTVGHDELQEFLSMEAKPVIVDGEFRWSDELDFAELEPM